MLLRSTDPFRDFDRLTQQVFGPSWGTTNRPAVMPMDAWREGDQFVIEFDLPGVSPESIDLDVERNVLTIKAERVARNGEWMSETDGVFVCGDMGRGQSLIVWAIAEGRSCAAAVDEFLEGSTELPAPLTPDARPLM